MSRRRATTIDPWPRTAMSWQRTLLGTAGVSIVLTVVLASRGLGEWGFLILFLAAVPVPFATIRGRQIHSEVPRAVAGRLLVPVSLVVMGLSVCALLIILFAPV